MFVRGLIEMYLCMLCSDQFYDTFKYGVLRIKYEDLVYNLNDGK